nr:ribonuclease 3-like protein 1 [Ipomoea batatas]
MDNGEVVENEELIVWKGNQPEKKPTGESAPPAIDDGGGIEKEAAAGEAVPKPNTAGAWKGMARSQLYEICAANRWNPPVFDCCSEEGPDHQKTFKLKVRVEISREHKATTLVCFSNPFPRKKAAAENAAEGALWFLNHLGYRSNNQ